MDVVGTRTLKDGHFLIIQCHCGKEFNLISTMKVAVCPKCQSVASVETLLSKSKGRFIG